MVVENCVRHLSHSNLSGHSRLEIIRDTVVEVRKPTMFGELIMIVYCQTTASWASFTGIMNAAARPGDDHPPAPRTVVVALVLPDWRTSRW